MPWTPHDLPYLAERSARTYRGIADFCARQPGAEVMATRNIESADFLDTTSLTWLDTDMCDMLAEMWRTIPEWTPSACIPGDSGLMCLETPFFTTPYESATSSDTHTIPVRAISWQVDGQTVHMSLWGWGSDIPTPARSPLRAGLDLEKLLGFTIDYDAVVDGAQTVTRAADLPATVAFDEAALTAGSVAGAAWLLMSQPRMVTDRDTIATVKKTGKAGRKTKTPVRVSVRSLTTTPRGRSVPTGRKATARWWVRGHWRQQAWGKNRALRKPIFIAPHTAGAPDSPVDESPKIQVWRTGQ